MADKNRIDALSRNIPANLLRYLDLRYHIKDMILFCDGQSRSYRNEYWPTCADEWRAKLAVLDNEFTAEHAWLVEMRAALDAKETSEQ